MDDKEFENLMLACQEIAAAYPDGIVFIGGIAVYLHAINHDGSRALAEFTHDADFYISLADMGDLRDAEQLTPNRRLSKHQLIKRGFEFDIYTERQSGLIVPYDQVKAFAMRYDCFQVASLEHLLALKLEAFRDRQHSSKGEKDAKDIIRIALIASECEFPFREELVEGYIHTDHIELLDGIGRGPAFMALARGNSKFAKELRQKYALAFKRLLKGR